jgi:uncharacterized protein YaeQ
VLAREASPAIQNAAIENSLRLRLSIDQVLTNAADATYSVSERVFLLKKRGESIEHVVMKWLSYNTFYHPNLEIERAIGHRYKPDLVRFDSHGRLAEWIDCGSISPEKLNRLSREIYSTDITVVKQTPAELDRYARHVLPDLHSPDNARFISFGQQLVQRIANRLHKKHEASVVITGHRSHLFCELDGTALDGVIVSRRRSDY